MTASTDKARIRNTFVLAILITLLSAVSWLKTLDPASEEYLDKAMIGSLAVYATARSINAAVSVLQGTEADVLMLTVTVGELLDPVNDLIERFSAVMLFALASIALQIVLLEISSHYVFSSILTGTGILACLFYFRGSEKAASIAFRFFAISAVIRFSAIAMLAATSWMDSTFLAHSETASVEKIQRYEGKLKYVSSIAGISSDDSSRLLKQANERLEDNKKAENAEAAALKRNQSTLKDIEQTLEMIDSRSRWEKITGRTTFQIEELKSKKQKVERNIDSNKTTLKALRKARGPLIEKRDCLVQKEFGENCFQIGDISIADAKEDIKAMVATLSDDLDDFASSLIQILTSLILKSVLIPLLFLYLMMKSLRALWPRFA